MVEMCLREINHYEEVATSQQQLTTITTTHGSDEPQIPINILLRIQDNDSTPTPPTIKVSLLSFIWFFIPSLQLKGYHFALLPLHINLHHFCFIFVFISYYTGSFTYIYSFYMFLVGLVWENAIISLFFFRWIAQ